MNTPCAKWKAQLLDAALTGKPAETLADHLQGCTACAEELAVLRVRRERLDSVLPLVAQAPEPSPAFRARVLAAAQSAAERKRARPLRVWATAAALMIVVSLIIAFLREVKSVSTLPPAELAAAENLAKWHAPTDVLLETPGRDLLRTTPGLGESYLNLPLRTNEEE